MLRVSDATNINLVTQKRLLRPVHAHTQGYPYPVTLDPSLRNADGTFRAPLATDTLPVARSAAAFLLYGGLVPGTVLLKSVGETVVVATGANSALQPFGLLGTFVGGLIDDVKSQNEVQAWRGPDSVYELIAPAWNDTGLAAAYAAAGPGGQIPLYAGTDGRLGVRPGGNTLDIPVATLVERVSASVIRINLSI